MSTSTRIIKNTGFLYAKMAITVFLSLYSTRLILNALGASDYGVFNVVGGAIAMLGFLNASMAAATQRFMSYSEGEGNIEHIKQIFNNSLILHVIIALFIGIILISLEPVLFNHLLNLESAKIIAAKWIYYFMIISTIFTIITVPYDATMNAHENMLYYSIIGIIQSFLNLGCAIMVTRVINDKLIWYGGLMAIISMFVLVIMIVYCKRKYKECSFRPTLYYDKSTMKAITSFAGWSLIGTSSSVIWGYGSNLILNNFFGTVLNAANGICGQINGQLLAFSTNMLKAVNPVIVKAEGGNNRENMFKATFSACKLSVLIFSLFAIPFVVECKPILKLWLKNVPPYTESFCILMTIQVMLEQISLPLSTAIGAVGKIKQYNIVTAIILYTEVLLIYGCFKVGFTPNSFRYIAIIGAFVLMVYKIAYCKRVCYMNLSDYLKDVLLRSSLVIVITFIFTCLLRIKISYSVFNLFIVVFISMFIFLILFYFIGLGTEEKVKVKMIFRSILQRYEK